MDVIEEKEDKVDINDVKEEAKKQEENSEAETPLNDGIKIGSKEDEGFFDNTGSSESDVAKALANIENGIKAFLLKLWRKIKLFDKVTWYELSVIGAILVCVVISSIYAGLYVAKQNTKSKLREIAHEIVQEEPEVLSKIPIYNDNAKVRMDNIYVQLAGEKECFLTFDDGPSKNITPQILDVLRANDVKATFFVLGSRVELYPELVKQAYDEGHYIANHGYSHNYNNIYSSPSAVLDEYNKTEGVIRSAIGVPEYSSYLFRFPGGSEGGKYAKIKNEAKNLLKENNVAHINWNCLSNDAVGKPTHESLINDFKSTSNGKAKLVSLMHDAGTKQLTADMLNEIINFLRTEGYTFKNFYDIMD